MRYPSGQSVRLSTTIRDVDLELVDAGGLSLTLQAPDGTQTDHDTPTHDGTGEYHLDLDAGDLDQLGEWRYAWTATGAGAGVSIGAFDVFDPFETPAPVISYNDALAYLHLTDPGGDRAAELHAFIGAATSVVERYLAGPAVTRTVTEMVVPVDAHRALPLTYRPFVELTGITADGTAVDVTDVYVTPGRVLRRRLGLPFLPCLPGIPWIVTYRAGLGADAPEAVQQAAKVLIGHWWATQRGSAGRSPSANDEYGSTTLGTVVPGLHYAVPNRALELLAPWAPETGIA